MARKLQEDGISVSHEKWCKEAERRSDRSLLITFAKMKAEPEKVRDYHWIMFNEMCFRDIQDKATPSAQALKSGITAGPGDRKPAEVKKLSEGYVEGAPIVLTEGALSGTQGYITHIWNEDFPYDMEIRYRPLDILKPMNGTMVINESGVSLIDYNSAEDWIKNSEKVNKPKTKKEKK